MVKALKNHKLEELTEVEVLQFHAKPACKRSVSQGKPLHIKTKAQKWLFLASGGFNEHV